MKCIPEETVDATWQAIAEMEPEQAGQAMMQLAEQQPALLQFVMEFAEDLDSDAAELCTYMVFVVYQMFSKAATSDIPTISSEQVDSQYESICRLLDQLHDNDDDDHVNIDLGGENQPFVYDYVSAALREEGDQEDSMELSEDDRGEVFLMMKCVIDIVDKATN